MPICTTPDIAENQGGNLCRTHQRNVILAPNPPRSAGLRSDIWLCFGAAIARVAIFNIPVVLPHLGSMDAIPKSSTHDHMSELESVICRAQLPLLNSFGPKIVLPSLPREPASLQCGSASCLRRRCLTRSEGVLKTQEKALSPTTELMTQQTPLEVLLDRLWPISFFYSSSSVLSDSQPPTNRIRVEVYNWCMTKVDFDLG